MSDGNSEREPFDESDLDALRRWLADNGSEWTLHEVVGYYTGAHIVPLLYKLSHLFWPVSGKSRMLLPEFKNAFAIIGPVYDPIPRMLERAPETVVPFRSDREAARQFCRGCLRALHKRFGWVEPEHDQDAERAVLVVRALAGRVAMKRLGKHPLVEGAPEVWLDRQRERLHEHVAALYRYRRVLERLDMRRATNRLN